jgi:hypothetical protein
VSTQQQSQAVTDPLVDTEWPDPLAPLRGLPDFGLKVSTETASFPAGVAPDAPDQDRLEPADLAPDTRPKVNTHVHLPPNFSAFETVERAVDLAADAGLKVLGSSNYYDFSIYARFAALAHVRGVFPLFGLEIISLVEELKAAGIKVNDPDNPGRMYICGKGITRFTPMATEAERLMQEIRDADSARMDVMTERVSVLMHQIGVGTDVTTASVRVALARRYAVPAGTVYLQERHVAQAFQEVLFEKVEATERAGLLQRLLGAECAAPDDPVSVQNQVRAQLMKAGKPACVEESVLDADMAYALVLALGGVPCYPVLADGASPVCQFEESVDELVDALIARGIWCAEVIPSRNAVKTVDRYTTALRGAGILVLGGTEHNTLDLGPITPECRGHVPVSERAAELFWEGACVVAAHQYLSARGRVGYVDTTGSLNPDFATHEQRISGFARLGATVIDALTRPAKDTCDAVEPTKTAPVGTAQP